MLLLLIGALAATVPPAASAAEGGSDLVLILDASGSMWGQIGGENKIVIARRALGGVIDDLPDGQQVGLVAYGHRRDGDCDDIETVTPLGPLDRAGLKKTVDALNPKGKTPITQSVEQALGLVRGRDGATVILVSDGLETCGGDPCATVRAAKESGARFVLHVVGFDVAKEDVSQLECAAQAGGGMYLSAEDAGQLSAALDAAVAMPADVPAGRLVVKAVADGKLHDVSVKVLGAGGKDVAGSRTYAKPETNPRSIPLPDGKYEVVVYPMVLKGDVERRFPIEIKDGATVEKEIDFSTGEISIHVTRNGELSDATYAVHPAGERTVAAQGRTYNAATSNPKIVRITPGTYDVAIGSVEIANKPEAKIEGVVVKPGERIEVKQEFKSGTLKIGAVRAGTLVDATVAVKGPDGKSAAAGRTYTDPKNNPKTFILPPGDYQVELAEIRGGKQQVSVTVKVGETVEKVVEMGQ